MRSCGTLTPWQFMISEQHESIPMLGNLTLLKLSVNRTAQHCDFAAKGDKLMSMQPWFQCPTNCYFCVERSRDFSQSPCPRQHGTDDMSQKRMMTSLSAQQVGLFTLQTASICGDRLHNSGQLPHQVRLEALQVSCDSLIAQHARHIALGNHKY